MLAVMLIFCGYVRTYAPFLLFIMPKKAILLNVVLMFSVVLLALHSLVKHLQRLRHKWHEITRGCLRTSIHRSYIITRRVTAHAKAASMR